MVDRIFGGEEVQFVHEGVTVIFGFQKDPDKFNEYTYVCKQRGSQRCSNAARPKHIFSSGDDSFFNRARALEVMLILFKAKQSNQPLIGFLPGLLQMLVNLFVSREKLDEAIAQSVHATMYLGCELEEQSEFENFIRPYVPWVNVPFLQEPVRCLPTSLDRSRDSKFYDDRHEC